MNNKMIFFVMLLTHTFGYGALQRAIKPSSSYVSSTIFQNVPAAMGIGVTSLPVQYTASSNATDYANTYTSYEKDVHKLVDRLNSESLRSNTKFNQNNISNNNSSKQPVVHVDKAFRDYDIAPKNQVSAQINFKPKASLPQNMYGKKPISSQKAPFGQQKRNISIHSLQEMIKSYFTPEEIKELDLIPKADGKYSSEAVGYFLYNSKIDSIKVLLQENLVSDKLALLDLVLFSNKDVKDVHDILEFYKNDADMINKALETFEGRFVGLLKGVFEDILFKSQAELIMEFIKTGLVADDLKFKFANYFAELGYYNLVKKINPEWFTKEFAYHKSLIYQAQDISSEQKILLQSMYNTATMSSDEQSAPYEISEQQIQKMSDSGLTFTQIFKYMPIQLFDTEKIFEILNATITAKLILKLDPYSIQKEHHIKRVLPFVHNSKDDQELETYKIKPSQMSSEKVLLDNGIYDKIIKIEQEIDPEYHTFVAGRNWNFNFAQDLWNLVKAVKHDDSEMENIIELTPGLYKDDMQDHAIDIQNHIIKRKEILENGIFMKCKEDTAMGMCLNSTLFENKHKLLEHTPTYFHYNKSIDYNGHAPENIFTTYGMMQQFEKYKSEINRLRDLHAASSKFGELLAVSIKKDKLDSLVYMAKPGARKVQGSLYDDIEECRPSKVLEKFYDQDKGRYPAYQRETDAIKFYFLVAPGIPGELGRDYKVQSIHVTDPEKFAEYKKGIQNLFEAMKKDFKKIPVDHSLDAIDDYCKDFLQFHAGNGYGYDADGNYQGEDGYRDMYGNLEEID